MKQFSTMDVAAMVKELQIIVGGKFDKIFQPDKRFLIFQLHIPTIGKKYLKVNVGKNMYLTASKESTDKPPGFCMYLRKKLGNSRIREIFQLESERIVKFVCETKDQKFELVFELFANGNILLLENNVILSAIEYKKWKDRVIKPKEEYTYPKREYDFFKLKETDLIRIFDSTTKESVVKSLALDLGLGGVYAEELCLRASIDKNVVPKKFKKIGDLFSEVKKFRKMKLDAYKVKVDGKSKDTIPFDLKVYTDAEKIKYESFSEALDTEVKKKVIVKSTKMAKSERMIVSQEANILKLQNDEKVNREKGELIYSKYQDVDGILKELKKAMKTHSLREIKAKLKGHKIIKELSTKDKTIVIEL